MKFIVQHLLSKTYPSVFSLPAVFIKSLFVRVSVTFFSRWNETNTEAQSELSIQKVKYHRLT